jgi:hypothetical protein
MKDIIERIEEGKIIIEGKCNHCGNLIRSFIIEEKNNSQ